MSKLKFALNNNEITEFNELLKAYEHSAEELSSFLTNIHQKWIDSFESLTDAQQDSTEGDIIRDKLETIDNAIDAIVINLDISAEDLQ